MPNSARSRWRESPRPGIALEIQSRLEPRLPLLLSEASELREAVANLIQNSVDALPQGGVIQLTTRALDRPSQTGSQRAVVLEVRDNGLGMDEIVRRRCVEPFFSTKSQHGSTGLGLAMVYGTMQRQKGELEIESTPGKGTCVRLTFPAPPIAKAPPAPPVPRGDSLPHRSLRILCIDDEPLVNNLMVDCLKRFDHNVATACNGEDGIGIFERLSPKTCPLTL